MMTNVQADVYKRTRKILISIKERKREGKEVEKLERDLKEIRDECGHADIKSYRGHLFGICEFCMKEFMTKSQIDEMHKQIYYK